MAIALPKWANEMRATFRSGAVSQFLVHGAIFDLVPVPSAGGEVQFMGLKRYLEEIMFQPFDVVVRYDRGTGIKLAKGGEEFQAFLKSYDSYNGTTYARSPAAIPRQPAVALGILDRFLDWCTQRMAIKDNQLVKTPVSVAFLIDYVQFIAPRGDSVQISGAFGESVIRLLDWSRDPAVVDAHAVTVLLTENLTDVHTSLADNPHAAKLHVKLPGKDELHEFIDTLIAQDKTIKKKMKVSAEVLAQRLVGLSRVNVRNALQYAARNNMPVDTEYLIEKRRELIEKECQGLLEFVESAFTLDHVAGHDEAKKWLREDADLLRLGRTRSVPMGYLMCGRIGTGKTWITTCWAGEIGIPCVVLKNFRDKWQGSTEGNLEKIFEILKALGQVMVFVDEADQATGKRGGGSGDSGLGGRVYAMLAKQMSDTTNRGKIVWVFATSRPDLLEVDLKRPGRLDVHIPLFAPQNSEQRTALFKALAKKVGVRVNNIPELPEDSDMGGNEMEAMLVRASRRYDLQKKSGRKSFKSLLVEVIADYRTMAHKAKLEYMDMVATKECTDSRFLPPKYKKLTLEQVDQRISELEPFI